MVWCRYSKVVAVFAVIVSPQLSATLAKSLSPPPQVSQQQTQVQNGGMEYPPFPGENSENSEMYYDTSYSEELPVKNSQFVPEESEEESNGNHTGFTEQRQVALTKLWKNPMFFGKNKEDVEDEGHIEEVVTEYYPVEGGAQYSQFVKLPYNQAEIRVQPASKPKSNAGKLTVESRRNGDGKIAVLVDDTKSRQSRSTLMTLSREDENDSEYDDLDVKSGNKVNSTTSSDKVKLANVTVA